MEELVDSAVYGFLSVVAVGSRLKRTAVHRGHVGASVYVCMVGQPFGSFVWAVLESLCSALDSTTKSTAGF